MTLLLSPKASRKRAFSAGDASAQLDWIGPRVAAALAAGAFSALAGSAWAGSSAFVAPGAALGTAAGAGFAGAASVGFASGGGVCEAAWLSADLGASVFS